MATVTSIPMVVCGRKFKTAQAVLWVMAPEFEIVHACLSPEQAIDDITRFAHGQEPLNYKDNVGSQNYSKIPRIIALGGGYNPEACRKIKEEVDKQAGANGLVWLWPDAKKSAQAGAPPTTPQEFETYAGGVAARIKGRMNQEDVKGLQGGVFYY